MIELTKEEMKQIYMYWVTANKVVSHIHKGVDVTKTSLDALVTEHYNVETIMMKGMDNYAKE